MSRDPGPPTEPPLDPRLGEALLPTEAEARSLAGSTPAWAAPLASATEPTEAEVEALQRRLRASRTRPRRPVLLLPAGAALLAAALLLAFFFWPREEAASGRSPSETPLAEALLLEAPVAPTLPALLPSGTLQIISPDAPVLLTADARMAGNAVVEVRARDAQGATLRLHSGQAVFEVDPAGEARAIVVEAGEYRVIVTGTRFLVAQQGERVEVAVERGSVRVEGPGLRVELGAGERWESAVAAVPQPSGEAVPATAPTQRSPAEEPPAVEVEPSSPGALPPGSDLAGSHRASAAEWARLLDAREARVPADELLARVEAFLLAWPDSPLAGEAAFLRVELGVEVWPAALALDEIERWLAANDGSTRAAEAHLFRARLVLAADPEGCARALPSLIIARERGSPAVRAEALSELDRHCPPAGD